ncbi:hypothetical protein PUN28_008130 [Cardiocondyla obscurior]|uniref:Uncharacterized protein n=1 Tax=Cardiocondyla obscurior TaxID=286306 RepID=A0AAW2G294_9HYME
MQHRNGIFPPQLKAKIEGIEYKSKVISNATFISELYKEPLNSYFLFVSNFNYYMPCNKCNIVKIRKCNNLQNLGKILSENIYLGLQIHYSCYTSVFCVRWTQLKCFFAQTTSKSLEQVTSLLILDTN